MGSNFIYSTRDHKFILKEWLDFQRVLDFPKYKDAFVIDDIDALLDQALRVASDILGPTNEDGEIVGVKLVDGEIKVPPSFHTAYKFMQENGWGMVDPEEEEAIPTFLRWVFQEYFIAANPAFNFFGRMTLGASRLIATFGGLEDKQRFLPKMYCGQWTGTMWLTEPNAGSDVGDGVSKAFPTDNPRVYKLKGTKCFITAAFHDLTENIINMVLARVEGAAPGTKGLSLFIVPKRWINEDGSMEPNDITSETVEKKMGMKGIPTVTLSFGDENNCRGILLGMPPDERGIGQGIAQMFQMMNGARQGTAHCAVALATVAYNNAVEYAKVRVQGRLITNPKGDRVRIIEHEDIRRMLLNQKATTEAMRALVFMIVYYQELVNYSGDEQERKTAMKRMDILNPLAKAYCSDMAWTLIADAIQVHGGYGFTEEYPVAKLARECKILSIWEGTNFIQSMDLVGRKWREENGEVFRECLTEIEDYIEKNQSTSSFENEFILLKEALNSYKDIYAHVSSYFDQNIQLVPFYATRVLHSTAMLYCGKLLAEQAIIARNILTTGGASDPVFYQGKILSARYYIKNVVPTINNLASIIKLGDTSAIEILEDAF